MCIGCIQPIRGYYKADESDLYIRVRGQANQAQVLTAWQGRVHDEGAGCRRDHKTDYAGCHGETLFFKFPTFPRIRNLRPASLAKESNGW